MEKSPVKILKNVHELLMAKANEIDLLIKKLSINNIQTQLIEEYIIILEKNISMIFEMFNSNIDLQLKHMSVFEESTDNNIPNPIKDPEAARISLMSTKSLRSVAYPMTVKVNLEKIIKHSHGGMWFHPREIINDEILVTSGRNGVVKLWDISTYQLTNEVSTQIQWVTSIKYESNTSNLFVGTYSENVLIYSYYSSSNEIQLQRCLKTGLTFIYGLDVIFNNGIGQLACGGHSISDENIWIYTFDFHGTVKINQTIKPLDGINSPKSEKKNEGLSKSLQFNCNGLLFIGLTNGIIEVYHVHVIEKQSTLLYYLNLALHDWVYQLKLLSIKNNSMKNYFYASNGNVLYLLSYTNTQLKIEKKCTFLASINDFFIDEDVSSIDHERHAILFIKLRTGIVLIYDSRRDQILYEIDETKGKGFYDNCLIASTERSLLISGRDNEVLIYKYCLEKNIV